MSEQTSQAILMGHAIIKLTKESMDLICNIPTIDCTEVIEKDGVLEGKVLAVKSLGCIAFDSESIVDTEDPNNPLPVPIPYNKKYVEIITFDPSPMYIMVDEFYNADSREEEED